MVRVHEQKTILEKLHQLEIRPIPGGGEQKLPCPRCQHERRSHPNDRPLGVNVDRGLWLCHHCGWSGSVAQQGSTATKVDLEGRFLSGLPSWGDAFMRIRGIDPSLAVRLGVGQGRVRMPGGSVLREVLAFPCWNQGRLVNVKYRGEEKSFRQVKGGDRIPFNLDRVRPYDTWIWTEGEMDVLAMAAAGLENALSVPDGAPPAMARRVSGKMAWLESLKPDLIRVKRHILAVDNDLPGQRLENELIQRLGRATCARVIWPEGVKDANDCLLVYGPEKLRQVVARAVTVGIPGVIRCRQVAKALLNPDGLHATSGFDIGFEILDRHYRPCRGELTIVTGMPGSGKSEFIDQVAVNLATRHGWRLGFYSPENRPFARHFGKLAEKRGRKPLERLDQTELTEHIIPWLDEHFILIGSEEGDDAVVEHTLESILATVQTCLHHVALDGLVLDPWNEVDHQRPKEITETEYVSRSLSLLRRFARRNGLHVWLVAHPMKLDHRGSRGYPVVRPYDISGSAHFFNKADNCLSVWRDFASHRVEIHVQKVRFRQSGSPGLCILDYHLDTRSYSQSAQRQRISP
ncbi:MAG: AAA family ATPase [Magnetococcales bacterium]|nr:AAA family ATPase [Magnetococcales bacterium]MBF0151972.1 AAA family ATPase [Magnetococcales bacterium]MBF0175031.1 AAA family ATPase [Magnetococcales bacterium]MBF0349014.1 AAA family ATPase [Magnetococcales bacterium]